MSRSNVPAQIMIPLDIPDVDVKETKLCEGKLWITVESQKETIECGICHQLIPCNYGKGQRIELRHLSVLGYETYIVIHPKRGQCENCKTKPTTTQEVEWYEQRSPHTLKYDTHLMKQLIGSTVEDVSMKEQVGYDAVLGALKRRVSVEANWERITDLGTIGIDEIAMRKGHKGYKAIITARDEKGETSILAVLADRKKKTVIDFLEGIPEVLRGTIKQFCTDMWEGYLTGLEQFIKTYQLDAQIVIDRFHVALHYREGFDRLRKQELKRLKETLPDSVYERDCHGALWLLRHNNHNLDDDQRLQLQRLLAHAPQLHQAYTLRTELSAIFDMKLSRKQGKSRLLKWIGKVQRTPITCFDKSIKTINSHLDLIANYFTSRANSGFVEGFNNKIKVIKRRCYGIKSTGRLFQHLWLDTQGYAHFI